MSSNFRLGNRYQTPKNKQSGGDPDPAGFTASLVHREPTTGSIITTAVGNATAFSPEETADNNKIALNRVVNFQNNLYNLIGGKIYKFNVPTNTWIEDVAFPTVAGVDSKYLGLYPINITGVPYLVTAHQEAATSTWRGVMLNGATDVWESGFTGAVFAASPTDGAILNEIQYKNKIYFISSSETTIGVLNPQEKSFSTITWSENALHPMDFAVYSGSLYCLNKNSSRHVNVHKIEGSITTKVLRLGESASHLASSGTSNFEGRNLLFVDSFNTIPPKMYAFSNIEVPGPSNGWAIYEIQDSAGGLIDVRNLENPLLPAGFRNGTGEETAWRAHRDQQEDFSTAPGELWLHFRDTGYDSALYQSYLWGGPDIGVQMLQVVAIANQWHMSYPHEKIGGGARFWTDSLSTAQPGTTVNPTADIVFRGMVPAVDGLGELIVDRARISYNIITSSGVPNGTPMAVKWLFDSDEHVASKTCSIINSSHGSVSNNIISGISSSSGVLYTVDWLVKENGLSRFDFIRLMGFASTTGV